MTFDELLYSITYPAEMDRLLGDGIRHEVIAAIATQIEENRKAIEKLKRELMQRWQWPADNSHVAKRLHVGPPLPTPHDDLVRESLKPKLP